MKLVLSFVHPTKPSHSTRPFKSVGLDAESIRDSPHGRLALRALSAVDGTAYADNQVFAFIVSKNGDWFCYDAGRYWAVMVLTDDKAAAAKMACAPR
jgi:hypothetical protein